jgi:hypothetical protein
MAPLIIILNILPFFTLISLPTSCTYRRCCFLVVVVSIGILADMLHHLHDRSKGKRFVGRQLGQHFAIQLDIRLVVVVVLVVEQLSHESAVTDRILSNAGRNALNPQFGIFPTFATTISKGVLPRLLQPTDGHSETVFGPAAKALGMSQQILFLHNV